MTNSSTPPRLGRCKEKGCKHALFVGDESLIVDAEGFKDVRADGRAYRVPNCGVFARCPDRHKVYMLKTVKGTYSPDHKCDARCLNAKGHECTCSCGGANHGRGYAVVAEASVEPVVVVREDEFATEKQKAFIRSLLNEREIPDLPAPREGSSGMTGDERRQAGLRKLDADEFTKRQASATIEWLLTLPKKED